MCLAPDLEGMHYMFRLTFALVIVLLAAPEPAPQASYVLRIEEVGGEVTRPAGASAARPRAGPDPALETPLHSIEFEIFPDRDFRVKLKHLKVTRMITGLFKVPPEGKIKLQLSYHVEEDVTDGVKKSRGTETEIVVVTGQRLNTRGTRGALTSTTQRGTFETHSSFNVWVTVLKSEASE